MQIEYIKSEVGFNPQKFIKQYENPNKREMDAKMRFRRKAYGGVYELYQKEQKHD